MKSFALKAVSLLLVLAAVLSVSLCGCGQFTPTETEQQTQATETESGPGAEQTESVFTYLSSDLERADYNREIVQLYRGPGQRMSHEIYMEDGEKNGDKIDFAVYQKNKEVENYLGIRFRFVPADGGAHGYELVKTLEVEVRSGQDTYQIVSNSNYGMNATFLSGTVLNLYQVDNLNYSKKYWAQQINENAEVSGAIYGMTGSISLYLYQELFVCFFNKTLAENLGIGTQTLYQAVSDGEWTLEYLMNLSRDVYEDTNQNGIADPGDLFGFGLQLSSAVGGFWSSCNIRMTSKDSSGGIVMDVDTHKLYDVVSKLNRFAWENPGVLCFVEDAEAANPSRGLYSGLGSFFVGKNEALFATDRLYEVSNDVMRKSQNYGVLPYPKYDRNQKNYYSCAHDSYTVFSIPTTAKAESDICGAVLECLAVNNHNLVMPVYYDTVLSSGNNHDPLAVKTLNIIFQNIKMDSGVVFSIGGLSTILMGSLLISQSNNVSFAYDQVLSSANAQCRRISLLYAKYADSNP